MNIALIGAHPDDCEVYAGGTAIRWVDAGHRVLFVSVTNGDAGHHAMGGSALAQRRLGEARESARRSGVEYVILDNPDGRLLPTLEVREEVIRVIRRWQADVVVTHRPNDYHPDHRNTSIVVQDSAFLVTVPNICPDATALRRNPIYLYLMDAFAKPQPFQADVAVAVDDVMGCKWDIIDAHESQFYEWLPWLDGTLDRVPADGQARRAFMEQSWTPFLTRLTDVVRPGLERWYGPEAAARVVHAEGFEYCEYGRRPTPEDLRALFPFLPRATGS